jgi:3-oxoacyl-[acyl-carrier protein] reductase
MVRNKKIIILGASSDIGVETVKLFLNNNFTVLAHYNKNKKDLAKIKSKKLKLFKYDLKKIFQFEQFIKKNQRLFSDYSYYTNLCGYLKKIEIKSASVKDYYDHLNVNYFSNFIISKYLIKSMVKRKFGRILFTSSIGTKFGGADNTFIYSTSKYLNEFFPRIYKSSAKNNVLINTLQIGLTKTKMNLIDKKKNLKKRVNLIPLRRMAKPSEVASYIYFLLSENNTLISNQTLNISGGE